MVAATKGSAISLPNYFYSPVTTTAATGFKWICCACRSLDTSTP